MGEDVEWVQFGGDFRFGADSKGEEEGFWFHRDQKREIPVYR